MMYRIAFTLIVLLALGTGLLVGALNPDRVSLDLLWVQLEWPLGLLILAALTLGLVVGTALTWLLQVLPLRVREKRSRQVSPPVATRDSTRPDV